MTKLSIIKCETYDLDDVKKAIKKSLELLDPSLNFLKPGMKVLIKPNILGAFPPEKAITTHPSVITGICSILKNDLKEKNLKLFVGESSGPVTPNQTEVAFAKSGIADAVKEFGVEIVDFDKTEKIILKNKKAKILQSMPVSKKIEEMDFIINVPKLKTHMLTWYTGAIKNFYGLMPGNTKINLHNKGNTLKKFSHILVDIYQTVQTKTPNLTIMDAVVGMEGNGPSNGTPRQTGIIASSFNAAALDYIVSEKIGFDPEKIIHIKEAFNRKLFDKNIADIEVVGDAKDFSINYKKPLGKRSVSNFFWTLLTNRLHSSFFTDKELCISCGRCVEVCPQKAIVMKGNRINKKKLPFFKRKNCILCYCCHELCPKHAIELRKNWLMKVADIYKRIRDKRRARIKNKEKTSIRLR